MNGAEEFRRGFGPLLPGTAIPLGDLAALEAELRKGDVAALIVEPIQGKGVQMPPAGFLPAAKALLRKHGALLICDEVQAGLGRTGKFFAYQYDDVQPDIVTVAKALSGGYVPVGAMLAKDWIFSTVYSSMDKVMVHSTTFKGGPLAMAAGPGGAGGPRRRGPGRERRAPGRGAHARPRGPQGEVRPARRRPRPRA